MTAAMRIPAEAALLKKEERGYYRERELGFWIYLLSDATIFAALFATYGIMAYRTGGAPPPHAHFSLAHAFGETLLLLTSSTTFGFASVAATLQRKRSALLWLTLAFVLGAGFVLMEAQEFAGMIAAGLSPRRSGALSAFFTLVGTHGLHVSCGLIWIAMMQVQIAVKGLTPPVRSRLQRLGLFWHFLDIIWIGIFSFVYLAGLS